jgi:glycosyltransferase involved in cell wall biosynthesis
MIIGIDASRAYFKRRTGVEEYSYQVIKHLVDKFENHQVVLYTRSSNPITTDLVIGLLRIPENWKIKIIRWPYLWTQIGLSLEILFYPVDVLFVPAHTVPLIHPKNTLVTIHGLEYEFCPKAYSSWARLYMRWSIRNSCRWAKTIIAVSNNTKNDLAKSYGISKDKIQVIYEGYNRNFQFPISNFQKNFKFQISNFKFLLFIGRLEERKNIIGIIKAFEILKEQYKIPHKLVLAGRFGYGKEKIEASIEDSNFKKDIILPGYITDEEKWEYLKNADVFLFPTFYEGFGIPILEAQSAGVPVICSNNSSIPEVVGNSAILVNPHNAEQIADAAYKLISDKILRDDIIKKGYENVKRFSWEKCAKQIVKLFLDGNK